MPLKRVVKGSHTASTTPTTSYTFDEEQNLVMPSDRTVRFQTAILSPLLSTAKGGPRRARCDTPQTIVSMIRQHVQWTPASIITLTRSKLGAFRPSEQEARYNVQSLPALVVAAAVGALAMHPRQGRHRPAVSQSP